MDQELAALASTGATTIVRLLLTDAWELSKNAIVALWSRVHPAQAASVDFDLNQARSALVNASGPEAHDEEAAAMAEWTSRLRRLLTTSPEAASELRRVLDEELLPSLPAETRPATTVVFNRASAKGKARVYQAGGDQHISER